MSWNGYLFRPGGTGAVPAFPSPVPPVKSSAYEAIGLACEQRSSLIRKKNLRHIRDDAVDAAVVAWHLKNAGPLIPDSRPAIFYAIWPSTKMRAGVPTPAQRSAK